MAILEHPSSPDAPSNAPLGYSAVPRQLLIDNQAIATSTPRTQSDCTHCGIPVPAGLLVADRQERFCCHGCETAYAVIHRCGLDRYYEIRNQLGAVTGPARFTSRSYAEFDDGTFRSLYVRKDHPSNTSSSSESSPGMSGPSMSHIDLFLAGVHCASCVWLVERLPRLLPGVIEARVDLGRAMVQLAWDDSQVRLSEIARILDSIGYPPTPARDVRARARRLIEDRRQLARLAVAGACAGNVMLFAVALYAGAFGSMEPAYRQLFRWMSLALTLVSLAWPGRVFFTSAWYALRTRSVHFDIPIALALGAGAAWSIYSTAKGSLHPAVDALQGEVYFDTVSVLVFALLVGRFLQARQQRSAADSVELLFSLTPAAARRVQRLDGLGAESIEEVPVEALAKGDTVEVRPGECIPGDGEIMFGQSAVDQAVLTGESKPIHVSPGDSVAAGTVNVSSLLRIRIAATGESTRIGKLMRLVEDGSRRRAPIVQFADRVAGYFTIGMLTLAGLTFIVWLMLDPSRALDHAVAVLVVTCPCALGLATPLVMTIAMGRAARHRTLIKGGDAIQRLATTRRTAANIIGTIFLDKTGTITVGGLALVHWIGDESLKPYVAAIESQSNHPVAIALARDCAPTGPHDADSIDPSEIRELEHRVGAGLSATIRHQHVHVGSPAFVTQRCTGIDPAISAAFSRFASEGLTPIAIAAGGRIVAAAALGDRIRPDAAASVARLRALGYRVAILSGDHCAVVAHVAEQLDIPATDALSGQSPEAKLAAVQAAKSQGPVIMVGDGVNDAAALAAADVGVAVHGGVEASLAAADIYLGTAGLSPLVDLIESSRRTMRAIHRNLWVSIFYNTTAATLAMLGLVSPIVAALVMPLSSLTAVAVSLRSRTFDPPASQGVRS